MNIAHIQTNSKIYGPGNRYVIWVQGCSLRCPGCWNKEMWSTKPKNEKNVEAIWIDIEAHAQEIEGITLLGGEPLEQYEPILELFKLTQSNGLTTMLFTGYEMPEIKEAQQTEILQHLDILITGRYVAEKRNTSLQWIGSENQEIHFLSERYRDYELENANYVEVHLGEDGGVELLGFPGAGLWGFEAHAFLRHAVFYL